MAKQYIYPVEQVDWGTSYRQPPNSQPIVDQSDSTYQHYDTGAGSIAVFPAPTMPSDPVIAIAVRYQQGNGGWFTLYNGWVEAHLMYDGVREPASRSYVQDGVNTSTVRTYIGPPVYRPGMEPWTAAEIEKVDASVEAATGPIGPNTRNRFCQCNGVQLVLYTADPVPVPTFNTTPGTVTTSSVNFSASMANAQRAQPLRAVFQVARDTGFTTDVRTFVGTLNAPSKDGDTVSSVYTSVPGTDSWTDLGPGIWHLRVKGRDYLGSESAWSARVSFTVNNAPLPKPSVIAPLEGQVVGSPYARRGALVLNSGPDYQDPFPGGVRVGVRWQFSQSSAFSSNVIEWLNLDGIFEPGSVFYDPTPTDIDPGGNGAQVSYMDPSQYLSQGVQWYARARAEDKYGQFGPWSTVVAFTVSHPPEGHPDAPVGGEHFDPVGGLVQWTFIDPWGDDRQAGYEVEVIDASGNQVYATGYVLSSLSAAAVEAPDSYLDTKLRWRVRLRDRDGIQGAWSAYQEFTYVRRPAVVIISPVDASYVEAGQPLITWDRALHPGATQAGYQVLIVNTQTRATVYDSGYRIDNSATSHAVQGTYLDNMTTYEVTVRVSDSNGLRGDHRVSFTTNFVLPPTVAATASPSPYESEGYVRILWDGPVDPLFEVWRIYRRPESSETWTLVAEVSSASAREARDWTLAETGSYVYAVVQVASRHGALVEGARTSTSTPIRVIASSYWLVVPEMDMGLRVVPSSDSFDKERESSSMDIIGRGRKMNFGASVSREGSLGIPVRGNNRGMTGAELMSQIDLLVTGVTGVYLRDPFGNYFPVALGRYSFERMSGVGAEEMGELEVPYVEVTE